MNPRGAPFRPFAARQRGMSLFPALVFLLILAMLGIAALGSSAMQERMAGNAKDMNIAFQAAEAALRDAEADIDANITGATLFTSACTNGLCTPPSEWATPSSTDISKKIDWTNAGLTRTYGAHTGAAPFPVVAAQPIYVIELVSQLPPIPGSSVGLGITPETVGGRVYRVTALATGARAETRTILQSAYIVRKP
jgi:type IV pilus assembly protein PilX